jgi:hypothetical protein
MITDDDLNYRLEETMFKVENKEEIDWNALALALARNANENNFHAHWGYCDLEDVGKSCVYNNRGDTDTRREHLAEFRRRMEAKGIRELGFASYPEQGEDAGFTFAMILDCGPAGLTWAEDVWEEMFLRMFKKPVTV